MPTEFFKLKIVLILTVGFTFASILGYIAQRIKLSPILGYLIAGYFIGPFSPGFVADLQIAEQLAEIGVILMMFGVGLHFKWQDLVNVKKIAIPGAFGQTFAASLAGSLLTYFMGWTIEAGIVMGMAVGVASTVVLIRALSDHNLLGTPQGHITVGWLIVEDILTVMALILLPTMASSSPGHSLPTQAIFISIAIALFKFILLAGLMFTIGSRIVTYALFLVARTRSHELFTLSILALTFLIAAGSAVLFGTSIALGAFIAGMVIGQTEVRHQVSVNALPLKDMFAVIFFLSVGMLFNPQAIVIDFPIFIGLLAIILIIKPLIAFLIVIGSRYPVKTAITVAIGLSQIGEFSFILAEEALKYKILPDEGYDIIVACALISIPLNLLLFQAIDYLYFIVEKRMSPLPAGDEKLAYWRNFYYKAIVVGFGPIGQTVYLSLERIGYLPIVIDRNVDTIAKLRAQNKQAVYGDASHPDILAAAHVETAKLLIVTAPEKEIVVDIIKAARERNPKIIILARASFVDDVELIKGLNVNYICCEEKSSEAFNEALLEIIAPGTF